MIVLHKLYVVGASFACGLALSLYLSDRGSFAFSHRNYWRFLFAPWKVIVFSVAGAGLTVIAPYTGDPTWDYFDASVMSVLCFFTAPWAVGVIYKTAKRELPLKQTFVAVCMWMFTVSLFYEIYLLVRDGAYNPLWISNIFASSSLYALAGLLANLHWTPDRGTIFAFMEEDWPSTAVPPIFGKILWLALILMALAALLILPFLIDVPGF
jgi:hypothetical protein